MAAGLGFTVNELADGGGPYGVAYDSHLELMTVTNGNNYTASIYNASTELKVAEPSVNRPRMVAVNSASDLAYIADFDGYLRVVDLSSATLSKSVTETGPADGIAYASGAGTIYLTYYWMDQLTAISASDYSTLKSIPLGNCVGTEIPAYDPQNSTLFMPNPCSSTLTIVNTSSNKIAKNLSVASPPAAVAYDGATDLIWMGENNGNVAAYYANNYTFKGSVRLGGGIRAIAVDPGLGFVYAMGSNSTGNAAVTVVNSGNVTALAEIDFGASSNPYDLAVDSASHSVWTTDYGGRIWVISPNTWRISFHESGLATGTSWYVALGGTQVSSSGTTISFSEYDGVFSYRIQPIAGYTANWTGNASVWQSDETVGVAFTRLTYSVLFTESGLPTGTGWGLTINGQHDFSSISTIATSLYNGTWTYTLDPLAGYSTNWSGALIVAGTGVSAILRFVPFTYSVEFIETGLPPGTGWSLSVGASEYSTNSSTVSLNAPNGTLSYRLAGVPGWSTADYSGTLSIGGAPVIQYIPWQETTFSVLFTESGLPSGTRWWLNVTSGPTTVSTSASLSLSRPNGTYSYSVATSDKEYASAGGSFTVSGVGVTGTVTFLPVTYNVTFGETGLVAGTTWSVVFNSENESGQANLTFSGVGNGTYTYTVGPVAGFESTPSTGSLRVHGAPASVVITFNPSTSVGVQQPTSLGGSLTLELIAGVVVLAAAVATAILILRRRRSRAARDSSDEVADDGAADEDSDVPPEN